MVETPDRRRKAKVCHVNILKAYHSREEHAPENTKCGAVATVAMLKAETGEDDGSADLVPPQVAQLSISEMLKIFPESLGHLEVNQQQDILNLVSEYLCLFSDVPSCTAVLEHDINF